MDGLLVGGYCYCCTAVYWCTVLLTVLLHMVDSWGHSGWVRSSVGVGWAVDCIYRPSLGGRGVGRVWCIGVWVGECAGIISAPLGWIWVCGCGWLGTPIPLAIFPPAMLLPVTVLRYVKFDFSPLVLQRTTSIFMVHQVLEVVGCETYTVPSKKR